MSKLPVEMRALAEAATRASSPGLPLPPSSAKPKRTDPDPVPHPLPLVIGSFSVALLNQPACNQRLMKSYHLQIRAIKRLTHMCFKCSISIWTLLRHFRKQSLTSPTLRMLFGLRLSFAGRVGM